MTVITAPAGYGKTVLVDQWAADSDTPVAQVQLGRADTWPAVAARIDAVLPPRGGATLVLNGVDVIDDTTVCRELVALIERAPDQLHIFLVARSRAHPVIRAQRGRTGVSFLTAADLTFTAPEARDLVRTVAGFDLSERSLDRLMERTEGWPVALELAAIGIRDAADADVFVEEFGGDERHMAAFLFDDVFAQQSASVRRFLVQTSILDRLSGPLCDAVTRDEGGAAVLRQLEQDGLFMRHVGGSRKWFVCQRMFREFLRRELRRGEYGSETDLLVRAGQWHVDHDDPEGAARCFIDAEAWRAVVDLTDAYGQRMFESGRGVEALRWLDALPTPATLHADVALRRAYLHTMLGESRRAAQILHDVNLSDLSQGERIAADALRATWVFIDASPESVLRAADRALDAMQEIDPADLPDIFGVTAPTSLVMMAATSRARALWFLGEVGASRRALEAGMRRNEVHAPWYVHTLSALALLEAWAGNLLVAGRIAARARSMAEEADLLGDPAAIGAQIALAHVARQRGQHRKAAESLDHSAAIAARARRPYAQAVLAVERALLNLGAGQPERGLSELAAYRATREVSPPPIIQARLSAVEVRLRLFTGDLDRAEALIEHAPSASLCPDLAAACVQTAVMRRDLDLAASRLDDWVVDDAQPGHDEQRRLWTAVVALERGDRRRAIQSVAPVVDLAERDGDLAIFLDGGRPVERLLRAVVHAGLHAHAERVLRAADRVHTVAPRDSLGLSRRELEVVRYLPTSLSSAEIAERLYISLNTLKTHLRTIYGKLDATNRREAIERAKELGLA